MIGKKSFQTWCRFLKKRTLSHARQKVRIWILEIGEVAYQSLLVTLMRKIAKPYNGDPKL